MPFSSQALAGLQAAVKWNPHGAKYLLGILREFPDWMRYKDDPYGPLALVLFGVMPRVELLEGVSLPADPGAFPADMLPLCEAFGLEWKERRFSKKELAGALEKLLRKYG